MMMITNNIKKYMKTAIHCFSRNCRSEYKVYTSINMDVQQMLQDAVDDNLKRIYRRKKTECMKMQAAATCIDNSTGNVVAIVGSRTQDLDGYTLNRAYQSYRQPGSSIKPIVVYTPYLQQGNTPDTIVTDEKIDGGPNNADGSYAGQMTFKNSCYEVKEHCCVEDIQR